MHSRILRNILLPLILVIPFVLFLAFRLLNIDADMSNSDAARWHRRSNDFELAIKSKNFSETYQSYHPGVTLMWLTSGVEAGLKIYAYTNNTEYKSIGNTDGYVLIDTVSKITLVIILLVLLYIQFKYIDILFDRWVALIYVYLIALEPYLIGINRWYHLTSLESFLAFNTFLAILIWAETKQSKYFSFSALFLGLALLTKFSTIIIIPILLVVILVTFIKDKNKRYTQYIKNGFYYIFIVACTFVILFPAMWVEPLHVLSKLLSAGINARGGEYQSVLFAERNPNLYYLVVLLFKLSPITLILSLISLFKTIMWRQSLVTYIVLYTLTTLSILSITEQKIERYIIIFLPAILLLIAVTLSRVDSFFRNITLGAILIYAIFVYTTFHPIYSAYYSPVLGGPAEAYSLGLYDDNGEFYLKAAQYLNSKGRDIHVHVPYNVESFSYYFKGKVDTQQEITTDYNVSNLDSRRKQATLGFNCPDVEHVLTNYNLDAVVIYKCQEIRVGD